MGNRRAIIETLFKVKTEGAAFRDSIKGSWVNSAAVTPVCKRLGQIAIGYQGTVIDGIYVGVSVGGTTTNGWTELAT
jgi:hypothetical protein